MRNFIQEVDKSELLNGFGTCDKRGRYERLTFFWFKFAYTTVAAQMLIRGHGS